MVRRNLRTLLGIAAMVVVVAGLTAIAWSRIQSPDEESSVSGGLAGRWALVAIETPEGTFNPDTGNEWIAFDDAINPGMHEFRGQFECFDFEGEFSVPMEGVFSLNGWGWSGGCEQLTGTSYAFDLYFGEVSKYELGEFLTLQSIDASVQFVYARDDL
jgi:hypothetical protein